MTSWITLWAALAAAVPFSADDTEKVGQRPYEMVWAHRDQDDHPPLVDFEDLSGWRVECQDAEAKLERTREQQIWGQYVGKLSYHGTGNAPRVVLRPPAPMPIKGAFDAVTLWVYGNNWGYAPDPNTPHVGISALFTDTSGNEFAVDLYHVDWTEWYLLHKRLTPEQISRVKDGAKLTGILVANGRNKEDRVIYLDNLAVFTEAFAPLKFEPRPERGIAMFPGQTVGTNTGPGKLPFPTREQTILPDLITNEGYQTKVDEGPGGTFTLTYTGRDGTLQYRLEPKTGTWSDISATCLGADGKPLGEAIQPCVAGGVWLVTPSGPVEPTRSRSLGTKREGDTIVSRWEVGTTDVKTEVTYTYRIWKKSLVIDVKSLGGKVSEVRFGRSLGLTEPRLVTLPFYPAAGGRPAVAVSGKPAAPLFLMDNVDWYLSNASILWGSNAIDDTGVVSNGGTRYLPKTDGQRNDCFERFFLTISPRFEEVLPTVANPVSPWKSVTGTHVWRAHGASNRERDAQHWTDCHRWGMTQVVITDHETGWRDGGESFTFRTKPAPGKGGDKGQFDYARLMQDKLGFVYGPYNNYTDFAPVNEYWSTDMVSRTPDNQLEHAWMRCYAPKPARAVEYCAKLAPIIQQKFHFSTAYCDVHTAVAPWDRVDYDVRVPGAGTFAAVFYSFGEIMLRQKKAWNGPVYSEGNNHAFYCGLTDGNYGQDQRYRPAVNPWLVDFDLRKLHDLCCNFGMGAPDMFYAGAHLPQGTKAERDAWLDRFLAATVAFGHPGFLVYDSNVANALRSYYMLQQLHSRYCLASASDIRYADENGALLAISAAVASGAFKRSQVVTKYSGGTITAANGSPTERMKVDAFGHAIDLPPNGYAGWTADGKIEVISSDRTGHRSDYAVTPEYLYIDGRGQFVREAKAAGNGIGICRMLPDGKHEVLLYEGAECGFAISAEKAVALDKDSKEIGPAEVRRSRGLTYVVPVKGAFSYILSGGSSANTGKPTLTCDRDTVYPGEHVAIRGKEAHAFVVPATAKPGERLWTMQEGEWIDFTAVPLVDATTALDGDSLKLALTSNAASPETFTVALAGEKKAVHLVPGQPNVVAIDLGAPKAESADVVKIEVRLGNVTTHLERGLRTELGLVPVASLPEKWQGGIARRGEKEIANIGQTGAIVTPRRVSCGDVTKEAIFMHPPYQGGPGYSFARYEPVVLPKDHPAAFRAAVGKENGSDLGDGIFYKVTVIDEAGKEVTVGEATVAKHEWKPIEADLSKWAGRRITIKLITDVGPKDNSSGDWGCWAEMRLESLKPELHRSLSTDIEASRREPGPHRLEGLTPDTLRKAKSARLVYDGKGLSGTGVEYGSFAVLNGTELGNLAPASGDEVGGVFQKDVSIPLTPEAIRTLGYRNHLVIRNPKGDSFSVRRLRIDAQLADGRTASSDISTATYTQPANWAYAEGIGVPFDEDITVDIWFRP